MRILAHRGSSGAAPENTLAAFHRAVADGATMIELDVRRTVDGTLLVLHDRRLQRTTNGRGSVYRLPVAVTRAHDAGAWFSTRFRGERIPTLREVLDLLPPTVGLDIEVKTDGDPHWRTRLAPALVSLLRRSGRGREILVTSFNHDFLRRLHRCDPAVPIGALAMPVRDAARRPSAMGRRLGVSTYICSRTRLRRRSVRDAHAHGMQIFVYGVDTEDQFHRALRFGVDAVITNHPKLMLRLLRRSGATTASRTP